MKKTTLFAATALLTILLSAGLVQAKTAATTAAAPTTEAAATTAPAADMHAMHKMPMKDGVMGQKMSEATRKLMHETMTKVHEDNKATFDEIEAKHKELEAIVKAPTFDKSAFIAKHEEIQSLHHKLEGARNEAMASVFEKMPAEERAQMGGMGMGMHHGGHMGKGPMGGGMGDCPMMKAMGTDAPAPVKK